MALAFLTALLIKLASKKGIFESDEEDFFMSYPDYVLGGCHQFIFPKCSELVCQQVFILEPSQPTGHEQKLLVTVLVITLLRICRGLKA